MKKKLFFIISILIGLFILLTNFPKGTYKLIDKNVSIKMSINDNLLTFKDPEYTKKILITDNNKEYVIKFWSETIDVKVFKRKNKSESFWVIEDKYRGLSRTQNNEFNHFTCWDCSGIEKTHGIDTLSFEFKNSQWQKN